MNFHVLCNLSQNYSTDRAVYNSFMDVVQSCRWFAGTMQTENKWEESREVFYLWDRGDHNDLRCDIS